MKVSFIYVLAFLTPLISLAKPQGITSEIPDLKVKAKSDLNVFKVDKRFTEEKNRLPKIQAGDSAWFQKDWRILPPGKILVARFNAETKKIDFITPNAEEIDQSILEAAEASPKWIRPALIDNLRRTPLSVAKVYANLITSADVKYRDEIAFQAAHIAPYILARINSNILKVNAEFVYSIAPDLKYVSLVEGGTEDNWFTTTKYKVKIDGDTSWVEIPKEIYYWWVLMPKLSDETPSMGPEVYNRFWRDYVYNYADEGYPLLKEALRNIEYMWDGKEGVWANKDTSGTFYPFDDTLCAIRAVARWVAQTLPESAKQPRPIQPNQILRDHDGNCGENQDLLNAGARAALLPVRSVGSFPGDHVWNELYWKGRWMYYQIDLGGGFTRLASKHTYPRKGLISAWRGDGYIWLVNDNYNPVANMRFKVVDSKGNPVDGAEVVLFSASYKDPHKDEFYIGSWGYTDADGVLRTNLGANITYGFRADALQGHDPTENNRIYALRWNGFSEGDDLSATFNLKGEVPTYPAIGNLEGEGLDLYKAKIKYDVPERILYGGSYWNVNFSYDDYDWGDERAGGSVDFFICDADNYAKFLNGEPFDTYKTSLNSSGDSLEFNLPSVEDFYFVFSNKNKSKVSQVLESSIEIYKYVDGEWEALDSLDMSHFVVGTEDFSPSSVRRFKAFPNPASESAALYFSGVLNQKVRIEIYNSFGEKIRTLYDGTPSTNSGVVRWDLKDENGLRVPDGIYYAAFKTKNEAATKKIVVVK